MLISCSSADGVRISAHATKAATTQKIMISQGKRGGRCPQLGQNFAVVEISFPQDSQGCSDIDQDVIGRTEMM